MLFYRAALPLSSRTLNYAAGIIRRHLKAIGSRWRKLNPGQEALLVLAYLRKGETFAQLAAGFGIGRTTAWRYVNETVELLAARAPKLREAVRDAKRAGHAYVILDGTLIPIDRVAADRPFYSGKHKKHGMNLQVIASADGDVLWVSGALPGSVHDKKAEWIWGGARRAGESRPGRPRGQGLSGQHLGEGPVQGQEQAGTAERGQQSPRQAPRPRRKGKRAAQGMEDPRQAPLLPLARRDTREGHPRIAAPRGITRLETAQDRARQHWRGGTGQAAGGQAADAGPTAGRGAFPGSGRAPRVAILAMKTRICRLNCASRWLLLRSRRVTRSSGTLSQRLLPSPWPPRRSGAGSQGFQSGRC